LAVAVQKEVDSILENSTWTPISTIPDGKTPINAMWIFKAKTGPSGTVEKLKARIVAKGNEQAAGLDFSETFAPVVRWSTIRSIISIAARKRWCLQHLDVITAYLHGLLTDDVYMIIPPGFPNAGGICKLVRALYGLRQASRAWYTRIYTFLRNLGLQRSSEDPNMYFSVRNNLYTVLLLYVDDIILTGDDDTTITHIKQTLMKNFKMTDLGDARYYLGVELDYTFDGIYFHQKGYIEKLLERFGMTTCTPLTVPMNPRTKLQKQTGTSPVDIKTFQSLVGGLLHATISRWDIQYVVGCVSRYLTNPQQEHLLAAKNILRYLKGTLNHAIFYPTIDTRNLITFSDADWAGDIDSRRSTAGILYKLGSAPIAWSSKLQPTIALSSTEAEYRTLSEATRNITYLRQLLQELGLNCDLPTPVMCDNISSLKLVRNPIMHAQTKYIDLHNHYIREKYDDGSIRVEYVPSTAQQADLLTKPLPAQTFIRNRNAGGLRLLPSTLTNSSSLS
jgi:hypothetical protein